MQLYCNLLKKNCIEDKCGQYNPRKSGLSCDLYAKVGHFLYNSLSPTEWSVFIRYIESIRPSEVNHGKGEK